MEAGEDSTSIPARSAAVQQAVASPAVDRVASLGPQQRGAEADPVAPSAATASDGQGGQPLPSTDGVDEEEEDEEEEEKHKIWDLFAEEYHDIVSELPLELQRNFHLVKELEDEQQAATQSLKTSLLEYLTVLATARSSTDSSKGKGKSTAADDSEALHTALQSITKAAKNAIRAGEDKVGLAVTMYESVDRHIRRLDTDLLRYEDELVIGLRDGTMASHDAPAAARKDPPGPTTSRGAIALGEKDAYDSSPERTQGKKRKYDDDQVPQTKEERQRRREEKRRKRAEAIRLHAALDMPINQNEPRYCYCNSFSSGQMIGCDNDNCARDWFHLECVGMDEPPTGSWWCDECREKMGLRPADEDDEPRESGSGASAPREGAEAVAESEAGRRLVKGVRPSTKAKIDAAAAQLGPNGEKIRKKPGPKPKHLKLQLEQQQQQQQQQQGLARRPRASSSGGGDLLMKSALFDGEPLPPSHDWRNDGLTTEERRVAREARKSARKRERAIAARLAKERGLSSRAAGEDQPERAQRREQKRVLKELKRKRRELAVQQRTAVAGGGGGGGGGSGEEKPQGRSTNVAARAAATHAGELPAVQKRGPRSKAVDDERREDTDRPNHEDALNSADAKDTSQDVEAESTVSNVAIAEPNRAMKAVDETAASPKPTVATSRGKDKVKAANVLKIKGDKPKLRRQDDVGGLRKKLGRKSSKMAARRISKSFQ